MRVSRWRRIVWVGVSAIAVPLVVLLGAYSGIYNVAASVGHQTWFNWLLRLGMTRSVTFHSSGEAPPVDLGDLHRIRLGAAHYESRCASCHGTPGSSVNPVFAQMLPSPPGLVQRVPEWQADELFWIVRHGLKYTGMPAWSGGDRPDEIWSVVAFLQALPGLQEQEYEALAAGNNDADADAPSATELVEQGAQTLARGACDRCHDEPNAVPISDLVPILAGQSAEYLARALYEYRDGERASGIMQPIAAELQDGQIQDLANYYSVAKAPIQLTSLTPPRDGSAAADATGVTPGSVSDLAYYGNRQARVLPCIACHGQNSRPDYPKLGGQNAAYLGQQLRLWQKGGRDQTAWGEVMGTVAKHLTEQQITSLAEWFAAQGSSREASQ